MWLLAYCMDACLVIASIRSDAGGNSGLKNDLEQPIWPGGLHAGLATQFTAVPGSRVMTRT